MKRNKIQKAIEESQEAYEFMVKTYNLITECYADKKIDNDEIKRIQLAIEQMMDEGQEAIDVWLEAKDQLQDLLEEAQEKAKKKKK